MLYWQDITAWAIIEWTDAIKRGSFNNPNAQHTRPHSRITHSGFRLARVILIKTKSASLGRSKTQLLLNVAQ